MKLIKNLKHILFFILLINCFLYSQNRDSSIAIMPFIYKGIDPNVIASSQTILTLEIRKISSYKIISEQKILDAIGNYPCDNTECALNIGKAVNADKVVFLNFIVLGQKTIIHFSFYNVASGSKIIIDNITSNKVEDLDAVMKRIAVSIIKNESISTSAEVGNIVPNETKSFLQRGSRRIGNLNFGYLFPESGYGSKDRSFTADYKFSSELEEFNYGIQLFAREGFGINIFSNYLFTKSDICPYAGVGIGFHWIHDQLDFITKKEQKGDGIELNINSGVIFFRTYSLSLVVNLTYSMTFNDFDSRATVLTIGVIY